MFSEPPLLGTCFHLVLLSLFLLRNRGGYCNLLLLLCGTLFIGPVVAAVGRATAEMRRRAGDVFNLLRAISRVSARAGIDAQGHPIAKPCASHHKNVLADRSRFPGPITCRNPWQAFYIHNIIRLSPSPVRQILPGSPVYTLGSTGLKEYKLLPKFRWRRTPRSSGPRLQSSAS